GGSDLLCYRATGPAALVERQAKAWDPLLDWAAAALNAPLVVTSGLMPVDQPGASLAALGARVGALSPFQLAAFHDLVALSGSLVLGLALTEGKVTAETAWTLSRLDEEWQVELWGADEEATEAAALKWQAFSTADRFFALCG
ncbi:MAG: ATPase, partial [Rhodobacterales bacterium 12-65-15]